MRLRSLQLFFSPRVGCLCLSLASPILWGAAPLSALFAEDLRTSAEEETAKGTDLLPRPLSDEQFAPVKDSSPFRRSLGLPESLVLTGLARIGDELYVTLFDTETTETHTVSGSKSSEGWQLVEVRGDEADLGSLTARIQVDGGQILSVRHENVPETRAGSIPAGGSRHTKEELSRDQEREARHAARNYREGFSSDGYPRQPPPEIVRKLSLISEQQRESINRRMIALRNRGLGSEERRRIYDGLVDRAVGGGR